MTLNVDNVVSHSIEKFSVLTWNLSFKAFSNSSPKILTRLLGSLLYRYEITKFKATCTSICMFAASLMFVVIESKERLVSSTLSFLGRDFECCLQSNWMMSSYLLSRSIWDLQWWNWLSVGYSVPRLYVIYFINSSEIRNSVWYVISNYSLIMLLFIYWAEYFEKKIADFSHHQLEERSRINL